MFRRGRGGEGSARKLCRCEATIAPVLLDGFACGRSDCWRTAPVQAAQDRFVVELVRRREAGKADRTGKMGEAGEADASRPLGAGEAAS